MTRLVLDLEMFAPDHRSPVAFERGVREMARLESRRRLDRFMRETGRHARKPPRWVAALTRRS